MSVGRDARSFPLGRRNDNLIGLTGELYILIEGQGQVVGIDSSSLHRWSCLQESWRSSVEGSPFG